MGAVCFPKTNVAKILVEQILIIGIGCIASKDEVNYCNYCNYCVTPQTIASHRQTIASKKRDIARYMPKNARTIATIAYHHKLLHPTTNYCMKMATHNMYKNINYCIPSCDPTSPDPTSPSAK